MKYYFNKQLYQRTALFKAAYKFTDKAYLHIDMDDTNYIVTITMKKGYEDVQPEQFQNELLAAMVRQDVNQRTRTVRELLLARALASTVIDPAEENEDPEEPSSLEPIEDILTDWFEKYE